MQEHHWPEAYTRITFCLSKVKPVRQVALHLQIREITASQNATNGTIPLFL